MTKILISYVYCKTPIADYNLDYFNKYGVIESSNIDYVFVINGYDCSIDIKNYPNVQIIKRENKGYDFGGHTQTLLAKGMPKYDYYFFLNSSVIGPIFDEEKENLGDHWTLYFINKINEKVKLVGTSIGCLKRKKELKGPFVEGFFFCTDYEGLNLIKKDKKVFKVYKNKKDVIHKCEYSTSKKILKENNYTIDCMLKRYENIDWRNEQNWEMNDCRHPTRYKSFYGDSVNPYEVIFHKWCWSWDTNNKLVNFDIIQNHVNKKNGFNYDISNIINYLNYFNLKVNKIIKKNINFVKIKRIKKKSKKIII